MNQKERLWGGFYLLFQLLILPGLLTYANRLLSRPLGPDHLNVLYFSLNFIMVCLIFHRFLWDSFQDVRKHLWHCLQSAFLGFVLYKAAIWLLEALILWILPDFQNVNDAAIGVMAQSSPFLLPAATILLVPLTEECLFRGLIFGTLYPRSKIAAYAVTTFFFAGVHVLGYLGQANALTLFLCFIQYLPAGPCLSWAYARSQSVFAPILIHMTVNQLGILSMR